MATGAIEEELELGKGHRTAEGDQKRVCGTSKIMYSTVLAPQDSRMDITYHMGRLERLY